MYSIRSCKMTTSMACKRAAMLCRTYVLCTSSTCPFVQRAPQHFFRPLRLRSEHQHSISTGTPANAKWDDVRPKDGIRLCTVGRHRVIMLSFTSENRACFASTLLPSLLIMHFLARIAVSILIWAFVQVHRHASSAHSNDDEYKLELRLGTNPFDTHATHGKHQTEPVSSSSRAMTAYGAVTQAPPSRHGTNVPKATEAGSQSMDASDEGPDRSRKQSDSAKKGWETKRMNFSNACASGRTLCRRPVSSPIHRAYTCAKCILGPMIHP